MKEPKKEINKRKCYSLKWNGKKHSRVQTIGEKKNEQIVPRATFSKLEQKILQFDIGNEKTNRIAWYSKVIIAGSWCFHFFKSKSKCFINVNQKFCIEVMQVHMQKKNKFSRVFTKYDRANCVNMFAIGLMARVYQHFG